MKTESERVTIRVGNQDMGGYVARPVPDEPRRFPAVVLFMEIFGLNPHIRSVVDRIAAEGYVVLAPDFYHRTAPGIEWPYDAAHMEKGMALIPQLKVDELLADVSASVAYLRSRDDVRGDRLGAMGFCIGGHIAYLAASTGDFQATASFYGGGIANFGFGGPPTVTRTENIKGKIICFFGERDPMISRDQVETIKQALYKHGIRNEVFTYPDASHAFFRDVNPASYHKMAADDAWKKVKKLFLEELHQR